MQRRAKHFLAVVGLLAGAGLQAAGAGTTPVGTGAAAASPPTPPAALRTWDAVRPAPPSWPTQRMAERVGEMSLQVQRDVGAVFPGEDALGTGTSMTH